MVIREYLVENFGLMTASSRPLGQGKQAGVNLDADWGSIQILIYPAGTELPAATPAPAVSSSTTNADRPVQVTAVETAKP